VFATLADKARRVLAAGHSAIVDAVFSRPEERELMEWSAAVVAVPFRALFLHADLATRVARVGTREPDASDADAGVARKQESYDLGTLSWPRVDASGTPEETLARARALLRSPGSRLRLLGNTPPSSHVGSGIVDRVDRDQTLTAAILHREAWYARVALHLREVVTIHDAGDLKLEIILIGPEPGDRIVRLFFAAGCRGCCFCLIDGILHAFQPQPSPIATARKPRTISDGVNVGYPCARKLIDADAVIAGGASRCP